MLTLASIYVWIEMLTSPNIYVVLFTGYMARPKSAAPRGHGSRYLSPIYYVGVQSGSTDCGSDLLHFLRAVGGGGGGVGGLKRGNTAKMRKEESMERLLEQVLPIENKVHLNQVLIQNDAWCF